MRYFCIPFLFFPLIPFGQNPLSVSQAIEKALSNNYQVRLIKVNKEISETQNTWGMAGMAPTFSFNLTNTNNLTDNSNNPASFFPGVVIVDNLQPNVDMAWTLFKGFGIRMNKQRFDQLEEQTKGNGIVVIENIVYDVIVAYYTALVQQRKLDIIREVLTYSYSKLAYFQLKSELGVGRSIDELQFQNLALADSINFLTQELAVRNSLRNLNLIMGEDTGNEYALTDSLEITVPDVSFGDLKQSMLASNQNLKNQFINIALQETNKKIQQSALFPVVSVNLGATPSVGYIRLFGDSGFSTNTNSANYYGTISARYTLFNGLQRKRNIEIADLQSEIALLQTEDITLKLSHQLVANFERYQTQSNIEDMALEMVYHSGQLWNYGKEQYEVSKLNLFDLNSIRVTYLQSQMNYYDRLFELLKTHYDLMRLTGKMAEEYKAAEKIEE